jgi:hypothetical protein
MNPLRHIRERAKSGQAIIFVVLVLVVLSFVMLWNFDLHKTLYVKIRARDAGDAAALAAARWQGQTLNVIGELNIVQAVLLTEALAAGETGFPEVEALDELRSRLAFVGPVMGLVAANQAAKNNRIYSNPTYTQQLLDHVEQVRWDYPTQFDPPWEDAWRDYADMLEAVAWHGIAAMPDNPSWYTDYVNWSHPLLNPAFYDAVASMNWCWFHHHQRALLEEYRTWRDWPPLPGRMRREPGNSEVFSLRIMPLRTAASLPALNPGHAQNRLDEWTEEHLATNDPDIVHATVMLDVGWHAYNPSDWISWTSFIAPGFPFDSRIREEYDVLGADAAVRLGAQASRLMPGTGQSVIQRTAAAKPFGTLLDDERIDAFGLVLPGFTDVRLIPMDTSTAPEGGSQPRWAEHIYEHLPVYMERGPRGLFGGCYYCRQLQVWEVRAFRLNGLTWLRANAHTCEVRGPGPGPGFPDGGTRRGH